MPGPLRSLITALVRVFWVDIVLEFDQASADDRREQGNEDDLAAAPAIAQGMLQVLVVEARNLAPVHGIGTNPYVRGVLGQHVRKSWTAWSNLAPAWNCLMDFPVVSLSSSLELEVISQAPLFGGDTRIGYVSIPLKDVTAPADGRQAGHRSSAPRLAYRCVPLAGASQGELVLILDYRALQHDRGLLQPARRFRGALRSWAAQFRAFFLYHYWPCDKSIFAMYLKEPVDITLLLISLSPLVWVRAVFYTVLLACLCAPWPPDEHQIVQFILAFKGTAIFTDGAGRMLYGLMVYYTCARAGTCGSGGSPGSSITARSILLDLYQEILVWCVCFFLLPRTITYGMRVGASSSRPDAGGRMKALLKYNLVAFAFSLTVFLVLSVCDVVMVSSVDRSEVWAWRIPENFYWSRVLFGFSMFPFFFLLHPQINKLLTHSIPTGYTRLGTLRRHDPKIRPRKPKVVTQAVEQRSCVQNNGTTTIDTPGCSGSASTLADVDDRSTPATLNPIPPRDPVEDLKAAVRWFPGGSVAVSASSLCLRSAGTMVGIGGAVASFEIRAVSTCVSLGLRMCDAGMQTAVQIAPVIPGSETAMHVGGRALEFASDTSSSLAASARSAGTDVLDYSGRVARRLPGGEPLLDGLGQLLRAVGVLAAAAESPGLTADTTAAALLQVGTERAEALKLEAAARLAEMLNGAERLAEREAAEAIDRIRPEIDKLSEALHDRSKSFRAQAHRAYGACDTLKRSVLAWAGDLIVKLPVAGETLVHAFVRELDDLQAHWPLQTPGWLPIVEAYSRVVVSSVCEAFLELRPGHRAGRMDMRQQPSRAPPARQQAETEFGPQQQAASGSVFAARRTKSQSPLRKLSVTPPKAQSTRRRSVPPRSSASLGSPTPHAPSVDASRQQVAE